jgi:hypothetical protein
MMIMKLYNTLVLPNLLHGSENWTTKARDEIRRTAGYTWTDQETSTDIAKELHVTPILDKIQDYKRKWIQHVTQIPRNILPRLIKRTTPQKAEGTKETAEETSWCVRPERVNKWPNSLIAT